MPLIFFQKSESGFPRERRNILLFAPKREAHIIYTVSFIILTIIVMFSVSVKLLYIGVIIIIIIRSGLGMGNNDTWAN